MVARNGGKETRATMERTDNISQGRESDDFGPTLCLSPEEHLDRKDQLFSSRKDEFPLAPKVFCSSEQPLLREGDLGKYGLPGRLKEVVFGWTKDSLPTSSLFSSGSVSRTGAGFCFRNAKEVNGADEGDQYGLTICKFYQGTLPSRGQ